jgi:hypothetical protein
LVVYLLRKRTVEVCFDLPGLSPGSVRKNFAVHVSLSSIFTMSKSRPRVPSQGSTSVEAELPNFADKTLTPVSRQHLCPFEISAPQPSPAGRDRSKAMAVYMAGSFGCQHPSMTKSTFSRNADFDTRMPPVLAAIYSTSADRESRRVGARATLGTDRGKPREGKRRTAHLASITTRIRRCLVEFQSGAILRLIRAANVICGHRSVSLRWEQTESVQVHNRQIGLSIPKTRLRGQVLPHCDSIRRFGRRLDLHPWCGPSLPPA